MGDKTHPFTKSLCNTFMQKVRVETSHRNKSKLLVCAEKHKAGEKVSIVTNWKVKRVGSRTEVLKHPFRCLNKSIRIRIDQEICRGLVNLKTADFRKKTQHPLESYG